MRIISGSAGGRKLRTPQSRDIRPTADRAREALFSIIGKLPSNTTVIDFFSGTGALGIEALSRGASKGVFVDFAHEALQTTAENITTLEKSLNTDDIKIIRHDLFKNLPIRQLAQIDIKQADLIMADPPYSKGLGVLTLERIDKADLLATGGTIVIEERFIEDMPEETSKYSLVQKRVYGQAAFWIYQHKSEM